MPIHVQHACAYLGVHPTDMDLAATAKRAYRRHAKTAHPDKGGDAEAFRRLTAAYDLIKAWCDAPPAPPPPPPINNMRQFLIINGMQIEVPHGATVTQTIDPNGRVSVTWTLR